MNAARVVPLNSLMLNNTVEVYINDHVRAICHDSSVRSSADGSQVARWGQDVVGHSFTRSADLAARCKNALGAVNAKLIKCALSALHSRSLREICPCLTANLPPATARPIRSTCPPRVRLHDLHMDIAAGREWIRFAASDEIRHLEQGCSQTLSFARVAIDHDCSHTVVVAGNPKGRSVSGIYVNKQCQLGTTPLVALIIARTIWLACPSGPSASFSAVAVI